MIYIPSPLQYSTFQGFAKNCFPSLRACEMVNEECRRRDGLPRQTLAQQYQEIWQLAETDSSWGAIRDSFADVRDQPDARTKELRNP